MRPSLVTLMLCLLWVPVSHARPVLLQWPLYASPIPIQRLVVWRGVGAGAPHPYAVIWDTLATAYVDTGAHWPTQYCYSLSAVSAEEVSSVSTPPVCVQPLQ